MSKVFYKKQKTQLIILYNIIIIIKEREREKKALIAKVKEERDRGSDPAHIPVDADCPVEETTPP